jgi:hypothetical protein
MSTDTPTIPLCRDCKYFRRDTYGSQCLKKYVEGNIDPVNGGQDCSNIQPPLAQRHSNHEKDCGFHGRHFVKREPNAFVKWYRCLVGEPI